MDVPVAPQHHFTTFDYVGSMTSHWTNYSINARDDEGTSLQASSEDVPACSSCKKRKLRCSRETPACSHCLTRRVAFLERILLDEVGRIRPQFDVDDVSNDHMEGTRNTTINSSPTAHRISTDATTPSSIQVDASIHEEAIAPPPPLPPLQVEERWSNPHKRKFEESVFATALSELDNVDLADHLPSQPLLIKLVEYFCTSFHHWIPYVHKQKLCDTVTGIRSDARSDLVLHALVAVTLRHVDRTLLCMDEDEVITRTKISHFIVETLALRTMSLESLQALIMIVFDYLSDGDVAKAWPLIGSLTRTVDYLQLTIEPTAVQGNALMTPLQTVPPTQDFTELEERRRLFWVIFLLDRFCSVSTGWNTSLTSEDVHRRLPADGRYFTRKEPVTTPFFGIWSKAAGRIGRSLANVPAQYNEEDTTTELVQGSTPGSANGVIDSSKLGAFAYCVEATESLSQVTTFFLQQRINWQDKEHAISWLTRFKELDLRLVQWKMFLPPRWKDSDISQDRQVVNMDPNLTLAHITHNTSMILLHHSIAYPPKDWSDYVALPKDCSAQTCQHAAVETANIVNKFLTHTSIPFVNAQFAFCTFIAAKVLLYEHQATRRTLGAEFDRMKRNLQEMSRRWSVGRVHADVGNAQTGDQAARYAHHLEYLHDSCRRNVSFTFNFYDHSCRRPGVWTLATCTPAPVPSPLISSKSRSWSANGRSNMTENATQDIMTSPRTVVSAARNFTPSNHNGSIMSPRRQYPGAHAEPGYPQHAAVLPSPYPTVPEGGYPHLARQPNMLNGDRLNGVSLQDQSLLSLSDTLMDAQFSDMDRVITFEDTNFYLPGDAYQWQ
ncbi:hypothetical protein BU23DRAFT_453099 [Bimuria novae-zelandiae CBS 107.79]|uniref:Zn(2)-C6 fungal-type domain-containing protein n=1 Tax=Bimuria novae-zelandiae CBS 107.79 TaxID=1447943 RepID=A0A6A5VM50_9PLEO|nr:hypothetical protein BU23DRAFT_453099 [Bimuria novae-zelandiae CBS 107.79]